MVQPGLVMATNRLTNPRPGTQACGGGGGGDVVRVVVVDVVLDTTPACSVD
jgi:hypothetical protein